MRKDLAGPVGTFKEGLHISVSSSLKVNGTYLLLRQRVGYGLLVDHVDYNPILAVGQFSFRIGRFAIKDKKAVWSLNKMGNTYFFETHNKRDMTGMLELVAPSPPPELREQ